MRIHDQVVIRVFVGQARGHSICGRGHAHAGRYLDSRVDDMIQEVFQAVLFRLCVFEEVRKSRMEGFCRRDGLGALLLFEIDNMGESA